MIQLGATVANKYRLEHVLGEGGMGLVVAATDLELDRLVAIKFLFASFAAHEDGLERFRREARAVAKIQSEHVARVYEAGRLASGEPYMVMEHLEGCELSQLLEREGPLSITRAVDYVLEICEALAEAHAAGIVHRDLKPSNLFLALRKDGSVTIKILDFGISKTTSFGGGDEISPPSTSKELSLTTTRQILGSPLYMSPEQLRASRDVDARSDIWSLGVILYELLAGRPPFVGDTLVDLSVDVMVHEPAPLRSRRPEVPALLEQAIFTCLHKDATQRFAHVAALAEALRPFASESMHRAIERIAHVLDTPEPPTSRTPTPPYAHNIWESKTPLLAAVTASEPTQESVSEAALPDADAQEGVTTRAPHKPTRRSKVPVAVGLCVVLSVLAAGVVLGLRAKHTSSATPAVQGGMGSDSSLPASSLSQTVLAPLISSVSAWADAPSSSQGDRARAAQELSPSLDPIMAMPKKLSKPAASSSGLMPSPSKRKLDWDIK